MLVLSLLDQGHEVVGYDLQWFGDYIGKPQGFSPVKADVRDTARFAEAVKGCDIVLHLACISNDPSFELDEGLSRTINYECFEPLVVAAKAAGVKRFIYCSTSSVYGISDSPDVREDHPFVPITLYNRYKGMCEPLLLKHQSDDFTTVIIRPSTVCGYSRRMRLDLSVNILTNLAVNKGVITVFGGAQMRPNLHIKDMVRAYQVVMDAPKEAVAGQAFNIGMRNLSIMHIAEIVKGVVEDRYHRPISIAVQPMNDQRSYQVNVEKAKRVLGFVPQFTIEDAINDICDVFDVGGLPNSLTDDRYYNVKRMHKVWDALYKDAPPSKFDATAGIMSEIDMLRMVSAR
jgi:nucleoside-diphosphate-sugar epimerase